MRNYGIMELNITQKKILYLLSINSRFTNKDIGNSVGISPDAVQYQIKNLVEKRKLGRFIVVFDYRLVGFDHYHYLVRFKDISKFRIEELKKQPFITFINSGYGKYDLQCIVVARNEKEIEKNIKKIEELLNENIQDFMLLKFSSHYKYTNLLPELNMNVKIPKKQKNTIYRLNKPFFTEPEDYKQINLDKLDYKIINELVKDPQVTYLRLAKVLNTSHETIRYRIANYVKKGFILTLSFIPNFRKHGYFIAYTFLKLKGYNEVAFMEFVRLNKHVLYSAILI